MRIRIPERELKEEELEGLEVVVVLVRIPERELKDGHIHGVFEKTPGHGIPERELKVFLFFPGRAWGSVNPGKGVERIYTTYHSFINVIANPGKGVER